MAQIGTTDKWKLYVVRKANDPPTTSANFTDYSDYIMDWVVKGAINQLSYFEAKLASIETSAEKLDIAKGNLVYIMSEKKLIGKFVIGKPDYRTDFTVKISGYQSSGTEMINRKLANQNMPKITYDNRAACYILSSTCNTCQGILVDGAENTILSLNPVCYGTACPYSVKYDYENRITAVDKLAHKTGQEWWVDHGTNDSTPYNEGDYLNVADKQGAVSSSKTFYFTGANQNAIISEGAEELETNANHVVMQGQNQRNIQVESIAYDSTGSYTCITNGKAIDGWLSSGITASGTVIPLTSGSVGGVCDQLATYWAAFRVDDEIIKVECITGDPPTLTCVTRGFYSTEATPHSKGADIMLWELGTSTCTPWENIKLCVDCPNCFALHTTACARIGTEMVCVKNICNAGGYACITRLNWDQMYAHGEGIWAKEASWTESNPENRLIIDSYGGTLCIGSTITGQTSGSTGVITALSLPYTIDMCNITGNFCNGENVCQSSPVSGSAHLCREYLINSIQQNGLFSKTFSDNTSRNRNMLDKAAQRILLTKKSPIKRIVIEAAEAMDIWNDVDIGDTVTLGDGSKIGLSDGEEVRITGFEFSFEGYERLLLYCNDKETRTYPSTDIGYVKEQDQMNQPKQQGPIRTFGKQDTPSVSCDCPSTWSESLKKVKDVLSPSDDFDAANKKYVDNQITLCGGHWCCTPGELSPCYMDCDILPNVSGPEVGQCSCLGTVSCYWGGVYGATIQAMSSFQGSGTGICDVFGIIRTQDYCYTSPQTAPDPSGYARGLCLMGCNGICVCVGHIVDPAAIVIDGSGITSGLWEDFAPTYMKPCESRSIYPKFADTCDIGTAACKWNNIYFNNIIGTYVCVKCVWADTRVRSPLICGDTVVSTGDVYASNDLQVNHDAYVLCNLDVCGHICTPDNIQGSILCGIFIYASNEIKSFGCSYASGCVYSPVICGTSNMNTCILWASCCIQSGYNLEGEQIYAGNCVSSPCYKGCKMCLQACVPRSAMSYPWAAGQNLFVRNTNCAGWGTGMFSGCSKYDTTLHADHYSYGANSQAATHFWNHADYIAAMTVTNGLEVGGYGCDCIDGYGNSNAIFALNAADYGATIWACNMHADGSNTLMVTNQSSYYPTLYACNRYSGGTVNAGNFDGSPSGLYAVVYAHHRAPGRGIETNGALYAAGGKSAVMWTSVGPTLFYSVEAGNAYYQDFGTAQLNCGEMCITLDQEYYESTEPEIPHVILTETMETKGLYVCEAGPNYFIVKEKQNAKSNALFNYMVTKTRKNFAGPKYIEKQFEPIPVYNQPAEPALNNVKGAGGGGGPRGPSGALIIKRT